MKLASGSISTSSPFQAVLRWFFLHGDHARSRQQEIQTTLIF